MLLTKTEKTSSSRFNTKSASEHCVLKRFVVLEGLVDVVFCGWSAFCFPSIELTRFV